MTPLDLFHEARLTEALAAQREVVEARPDDPAERLTLCEFLTFAGHRAEARIHLDAIDPDTDEMADYVAEWHDLLDADTARHSSAEPTYLIPPPPYLARRQEALARIAAGDDAGLDALAEADELVPHLEGHVDGRPFDGWRDTDDAVGPALELVIGGRFVCLPMEHLGKLRLSPVDVPRDTLYRPAVVRLSDGRTFNGYVFGLYVGTADHDEDGLRIGAGVDWVERGELMRGVGLKTFLFGEEELSLDEFSQIELRG
jgi:type VI secretion system protein ImpE